MNTLQTHHLIKKYINQKILLNTQKLFYFRCKAIYEILIGSALRSKKNSSLMNG